MAILLKAAFFILFGINTLVVLFCIFIFFKLLIDPHQKLSEAITMLSVGCIAAGLYFAYQNEYITTDYKRGLITLGTAILVGFGWLIVRWFFNPLSW